MKNIKRNLFFGFGISISLLIVSSVASYVSIRNLLASATLVNHTNSVIKELENVISLVKDAETGQRGYLLTKDVIFLMPYQGAQNNVNTALQNVKSLTADNPLQQRSVDSLSRTITRRFLMLQDLIDQRKENREVSLSALYEGRQLMDEVRIAVAAMEDREQALLQERTASLNRYSGYTPVLIVITAILSIIVTFVFFFRVNNDFEKRAALQAELEKKDEEISKRIIAIEEIAARISSGDYATRVTGEESDTLGSLAGSLNKMAASLETSFTDLAHKEWLQTGIAGLNESMKGEQETTKLAANIIQFVAQYTNCAAGAVYLLEKKQLRFAAGFSYTPTEANATLQTGQGLVGQSIQSKKEILINEVASADILIDYTGGKIKPAQLIAFPMFFENKIMGAIELATTTAFTARELEFFKAVSHSTGIVINTSENNMRLKELLEETQAQAEELQSQHTELENINAELEAQSEKLQVSEEELKVQQEELLQANSELEERTRLLEEKNQLIAERNREIQQKAEELELSTKYKSEFLANMSHELRTPLNSILLLSRLLKENNENNLSNSQVEYAQVIQTSGQGLLSLIDEILDLSKIESGKMELDYGSVSINEVMSSMRDLFAPLANEKHLNLQFDVEKNVPTIIETDKMRLEQILKNLLSNALKFTSQGFVGLHIAESEGQIIFSVKDSGIGIPKEKQSLIFDAFQQADGSTRRKYGGTGLGLSISRELARLLGGEITVHSEEGKGSTFSVSVPASKSAKKSPSALTRTIHEIMDEEQDDALAITPDEEPKYLSATIPQAIEDDRNVIVPGDKVILIVEDDTAFAKSLLNYARQKQYKGVVSVRGDEGIELAKKYKPLAVLLDIQLPVRNGWEVMEALKSDVETRHIPVHIMSSYEVKKESLTKGAIDFINKPMAYEQMNDIFKKIEDVLTRHPKKVLIVEENAKHAKALAYFLETNSVNAEIKNSVNDGIETLVQEGVDCVILDMGIPDQKSYDTLEEVKKTKGLEDLPIIIFTGKSLSRAEELRIKQYADSIVIKTAHSYKRILDEVSLFLHLVEENRRNNTSQRLNKLGSLNEVLKNKTVMVVDDDVRNIYSLTKALEAYNINVISAIDGKEALQQLDAHPEINLVLMDMMMPEMDGYEATTRIRRIPRYKKLPVIAVTAKAMTGDREKCISAGASDYVTKPVDIDQLLSLLRVWLYDSI